MVSLVARMSSKGQLTIPIELRREWKLEDGDSVEFWRSADGQVVLRPLNLPVTSLFGLLAHLKPDPAYTSDDDAIADQATIDDEATMSGGRRSRAA